MHPEKEIAIACQFFIYLSYGVLIFLGRIRDVIDSILGITEVSARDGYAPITRQSENFYRRRLYQRLIDCFNRPITGPASARTDVLNRTIGTNPPKPTGEVINCLNLSSYNYLGFGTPGHKLCEKNVLNALDRYGVSMCSSVSYAGTTELHHRLEKCVANFLSVENAMVFGMGWGTNSTAIPALVGKGCLIVSDSINHNSIVTGARASGAVIKTFPHNDTKYLEKLIRKAIVDGQPRSHRPWKKILIIVEGVYSMEGEMCDLRTIVAIKKKYKCYLYLDEAHSIGAMGKHGRGVCEVQNVDTKDVDIMMGTFTKSFGAIGGYIAGSHNIIESIRRVCASSIFTSGLSPVCCAQVLSAFEVIDSEEGRERIDKLVANSDYVRKTLLDRGLHVIGDYGTAVVPFIIGHPAKMPALSRTLLKHGIAIVVVGFPATPLLSSRVRLCVSASHDMKDLEKACDILDEVADLFHLKYKRRTFG